jgi:hypothetical protein
MSNKIYLYTDEAGNTGTDLFNDIHQSFFYTATIFSKKDIDINKNIKNKFETILLTLQSDNSQIKEIHFTELNEEEKSFVTNEIIDILEEYNLELLISIIEKKYLPKLFFIDEFFDSGINPIIPFDIYNIRIHRFFLVFGITQNFTDEDSERFYKLFRSMDTEKIILFIKEIKPKLLNNQSGIYKVLIDKALTYAAKVQDMLAEKYRTNLIKVQKLHKILPKLSEQGYPIAIIIGSREADEEKVTIRDLNKHRQVTVSLREINEKPLENLV